MNALLSSFVFLNPWLLAALGALPVLWFLLRIIPPKPRLVFLPTTRFLAGLIPEEQTSSHTPWWILLLRLLIVALVIIALARPVYNPADQLPNTKTIRLIIDNGWASAQTWDRQMSAAEETLNKAGRENKEIFIITTAPLPGAMKPASQGPLAHAQAASILKGLKPLPWPADYKQLLTALTDKKPGKKVYSYWFAHGLDEGGANDVLDELKSQGGLTYLLPPPENLPVVLKLPKKRTQNLEIAVDAPKNIPKDLPVSVQALSENGQTLDLQTTKLDPEKLPANITFDIPEILRNDVSQFRITAASGAGGVFTLDERFRKRDVGIVGSADESKTKPFIEAVYYLTRALEPYTTLHLGSVEDIIQKNPSMIILPDIAGMPAQTLNNLVNWVKEGGTLLRFAGPNMTRSQREEFLVPVPLRSGGRSTQGSLSWENPPKLLSFSENSPFYGLTIHEDIIVRQQALAEPVQDLGQKTWATLEDGTPLITAAPLEKGQLVMIHTTASPEWSNLALSGLYVQILQRLISLSGQSHSLRNNIDGFLKPLWVLDGFGTIKNPENWAQPIPAAKFDETAPSAVHPPGLYGRSGYRQSLNIGNHVKHLHSPDNFPVGVHREIYGNEYEQDLMPFVLYAALALLLLDWLIMIALIAGLKPLARLTAAAVLLMAVPAHAQDALQSDLTYADDLYLAYIQTGNPTIDATSHNGLENLVDMLKRRTSAEPAGIAALNPERDTLTFFPLIYWPLSAGQVSLSNKALLNIQHYLDHGGTILFDTRDRNYAASALRGTQNSEILRQMIGALNIPPLAPINKDHVLSRSFYLLDSFPGRYTGGTLWVETNSANGRDGVSSVIIGSHDWAAAWASGRANSSSLSGGSRQQEMAYRFGINLVMYALTGNYKADQVHVQNILERLGQ